MGKHFSLCFPILELTPSTQSGLKTMPDAAGTWLVCYEEDQGYTWLFAGADIDLTAMQAGDTVEIAWDRRMESGGAYVLGPLNTYNGAQTNPWKHIEAESNLYGMRIRAHQTAGVARSFYMEFSEGKK